LRGGEAQGANKCQWKPKLGRIITSLAVHYLLFKAIQLSLIKNLRSCLIFLFCILLVTPAQL
ncbi:hypothetical protein N9046_05415, partial [Akkermansiaceae bacterium]|nr:hypothetical protein [Akkermansiaceae bacterium]